MANHESVRGMICAITTRFLAHVVPFRLGFGWGCFLAPILHHEDLYQARQEGVNVKLICRPAAHPEPIVNNALIQGSWTGWRAKTTKPMIFVVSSTQR